MHTGRLAHGRLPLPCTALLAPCSHPARAFHRLPLARSLRARSAGALSAGALSAGALCWRTPCPALLTLACCAPRSGARLKARRPCPAALPLLGEGEGVRRAMSKGRTPARPSGTSTTGPWRRWTRRRWTRWWRSRRIDGCGLDGGGVAGGGRDDDHVAAVSAAGASAGRTRHRRSVSDSQAGGGPTRGRLAGQT